MGRERKIAALLAFIVAGLIALTINTTLGWKLDYITLEALYSLRGERTPPKDVLVVAMDEDSYSALGVPLSQPWPRAIHAQLLEKLAALKAKRALFDILFLDKGQSEADDAKLEAAIAGLPTTLGVEVAKQSVAGAGGTYLIDQVPSPYKPFAIKAVSLGLIGLPEEDGVVIRFLSQQDRVGPAANYQTLSEIGAGLTLGDNSERPGPRDLINFYGSAASFPSLSYYQVLQDPPIRPELIQDKVIFIGLSMRTDTGPAQKDVFRIPSGGERMFGLKIHATAAANLIEKSWIRRSSAMTETLVSFLVALALVFCVFVFPPIAGAGIVVGGGIAWFVLAYIAFTHFHFIPGLLVFGIALPLCFLGSTLFYYFVVRRSAQAMRTAFEFYLSPEMVKTLAQNKSVMSLGGTKMWATALFTDIADFTKITEDMPAEKVSEMLNAYFTHVMEVIFENNGTLIKFIGDAVFVIWGAPIKINNHAELAVKTALMLDKAVRSFNATGKYPALHTRIGAHTGPMVVGNLGSARRFDYTAIGDAVNLASRVEGLNKFFGTSILFTDAVKKDAGSTIQALEIASVRVKGKREAVTLFTSFADFPINSVVEEFGVALNAWRTRDWPVAKAKFEEIGLRETRLAGVCNLYISKIARFEISPLDAGWQGEIEFTEK